MSTTTALTICFAIFASLVGLGGYVRLHNEAEETKRMTACVQNGGEWIRPHWWASQHDCTGTNEGRDSE